MSRRRPRLPLTRGYTVVEVVISLALLAISAVGVVSMMKTAVIGNMRSRNLSTAQAVAQGWVERLRADATVWTESQGLVNTKWLSRVGANPAAIDTGENVWFVPAADAAYGVSPTADVRGVDALNGEAPAFCTNIRLVQLQENAIRADVRVFWLAYQGGGNIDPTFCSGNVAYLQHVSDTYDPTKTDSAGHFHTVYLTTVFHRNDQL